MLAEPPRETGTARRAKDHRHARCTAAAPRVKVGDLVFFRILRRWYAENRDGNVTTADFIALSERESRRDLDAFFAAWLTTPGKPASW